MRMRIPPAALVGLGCLIVFDAGLALVLTRDAMLGHPAGTDLPVWEQQLPTISEGGSAQVTVRRYRETLARPVFSKARSPYRPEPPRRQSPAIKSVAKPRPMVDAGITMAGVILSGGARKAYLLNRNGRHGVWVSEGDTISGWKVQSVDHASVTLKQNDRTIEVLLYAQKKVAGPMGP